MEDLRNELLRGYRHRTVDNFELSLGEVQSVIDSVPQGAYLVREDGTWARLEEVGRLGDVAGGNPDPDPTLFAEATDV